MADNNEDYFIVAKDQSEAVKAAIKSHMDVHTPELYEGIVATVEDAYVVQLFDKDFCRYRLVPEDGSVVCPVCYNLLIGRQGVK